MVAIDLNLEGDGIWPDLRGKHVIHLTDGSTIGIAALPGGMRSGRPSVAIRIDLDGQRVVFVETSLRLFLAAADALRARYGQEL